MIGGAGEDIPSYPPFTKKEEAKLGVTAIAGAASWKSTTPHKKSFQSLALSDVLHPHPITFLMLQGDSAL